MRESVKEFFTLLPYVLPCKFCRYSLTEYLEEDPVESHLNSRAALTKWMYRLHNLVNKKLRGQGLLHDKNPPFTSVKKIYEERVQQGCIRTEFEGWDFLFSIAENHPYSTKGSTPMPNVPEEILKSKNPVETTPVLRNPWVERNRWNIMTPEERIPFYTNFWKSVGKVLPFEEWRTAWSECDVQYEKIKSRTVWKKELWRVRCCMEKKLELVNRENFDSVCKRLREHSSGCNKKKRGKTCRRTTTKIIKTRKINKKE